MVGPHPQVIASVGNVSFRKVHTIVQTYAYEFGFNSRNPTGMRRSNTTGPFRVRHNPAAYFDALAKELNARKSASLEERGTYVWAWSFGRLGKVHVS